MKLYRGTIELQSKDHRPDFHNVRCKKRNLCNLFTPHDLFRYHTGMLT
jgi:hypothetical protein